MLARDVDEVTFTKPAFELPVRDAFTPKEGFTELGLRLPVVDHFKAGELDFWVIAVDFKFRSGTESCTRCIWEEQCKDIVTKIDERPAAHGENDFLLAGDVSGTWETLL